MPMMKRDENDTRIWECRGPFWRGVERVMTECTVEDDRLITRYLAIVNVRLAEGSGSAEMLIEGAESLDDAFDRLPEVKKEAEEIIRAEVNRQILAANAHAAKMAGMPAFQKSVPMPGPNPWRKR